MEGVGAEAHKNPVLATSPSACGFVVFSRSSSTTVVGESPTAKVTTLHNSLVIESLIHAVRVQRGMPSCGPPRDEDVAVVFMDGCGAPLRETVREDRLDADEVNMISRGKTNPNRTLPEQANDKGSMFRHDKQLAGKMAPSGE